MSQSNEIDGKFTELGFELLMHPLYFLITRDLKIMIVGKEMPSFRDFVAKCNRTTELLSKTWKIAKIGVSSATYIE